MPPLENICVTDSAGRMGRPSLGVKFTAIRLTPEMLARIDAAAGTNRRSAFIRAAVEEKLAREDTNPKP